MNPSRDGTKPGPWTGLDSGLDWKMDRKMDSIEIVIASCYSGCSVLSSLEGFTTTRLLDVPYG